MCHWSTSPPGHLVCDGFCFWLKHYKWAQEFIFAALSHHSLVANIHGLNGSKLLARLILVQSKNILGFDLKIDVLDSVHTWQWFSQAAGQHGGGWAWLWITTLTRKLDTLARLSQIRSYPPSWFQILWISGQQCVVTILRPCPPIKNYGTNHAEALSKSMSSISMTWKNRIKQPLRSLSLQQSIWPLSRGLVQTFAMFTFAGHT